MKVSVRMNLLLVNSLVRGVKNGSIISIDIVDKFYTFFYMQSVLNYELKLDRARGLAAMTAVASLVCTCCSTIIIINLFADQKEQQCMCYSRGGPTILVRSGVCQT